jgi:hypothetical protein
LWQFPNTDQSRAVLMKRKTRKPQGSSSVSPLLPLYRTLGRAKDPGLLQSCLAKSLRFPSLPAAPLHPPPSPSPQPHALSIRLISRFNLAFDLTLSPPRRPFTIPQVLRTKGPEEGQEEEEDEEEEEVEDEAPKVTLWQVAG